MWAVIGKWLANAVLLPLLKKTVVALYTWAVNTWVEWRRKRKLKKENTKKVKDYEDADNMDDARDSFGKLP